MNCPYCNSWNPDNAEICSGCGKNLRNPGTNPNPAPTYNAPNYGNPPVYNQPPTYNNAPNYGNPPVYNQPPVNNNAPTYYTTPSPNQQDAGKGMAIASLILGIVSFFCFAIIAGPLAIIFGCVAKSQGSKSGMATAGIVTGAIGVGLMIVINILTFVLQMGGY